MCTYEEFKSINKANKQEASKTTPVYRIVRISLHWHTVTLQLLNDKSGTTVCKGIFPTLGAVFNKEIILSNPSELKVWFDNLPSEG